MLARTATVALLALVACKGSGEAEETGSDFLAVADTYDHVYGISTGDVEWGEVRFFFDYFQAEDQAKHDDEPLFVQFNEVPG